MGTFEIGYEGRDLHSHGKEVLVGVPVDSNISVRKDTIAHYHSLKGFYSELLHGNYGTKPAIGPFTTHIAVMSRLSADFWAAAEARGFSRSSNNFPPAHVQDELLATAKAFYEGKIDLLNENTEWLAVPKEITN